MGVIITRCKCGATVKEESLKSGWGYCPNCGFMKLEDGIQYVEINLEGGEGKMGKKGFVVLGVLAILAVIQIVGVVATGVVFGEGEKKEIIKQEAVQQPEGEKLQSSKR